MTYLFDVNVLIAFLDRYHVHHTQAHRWAAGHSKSLRWATCPLVENAFVRITGKPSYPNSFGSATAALEELRRNCALPNHIFWPDDISLCDVAVWSSQHIVASSHITDLY